MTDFVTPTAQKDSGLGGVAVVAPEHTVSAEFIRQLELDGAPEMLITAIIAGNDELSAPGGTQR